MRLFVAVDIPDSIRGQLALLQGGVPGARWTPQENFHLTLRFIGEVDGRTAHDIDLALAAVAASPFSISLAGLGVFSEKQPRVLWAGVARCEPLVALAAKIELALQRIGLEPETRKFAPHVTLAKLRSPDMRRLREFLAAHGGFSAPPFPVGRFTLYSSLTHAEGSLYTAERHYVL